MRVLQLIGSTGIYGAEAVVASLARDLRSEGVETCVGHVRYAAPDVLKLEEHLPDCDVFPLAHGARLDLRIFNRLRTEIKRRDIHLIHSHGYKPDFYGGLIARVAGIPVMSTCHLWTKATTALKAYDKVDAALLRKFNRVVAVSQPILQELKTVGIADGKLDLIPNGIAVTPFLAAAPLYRHLFPRDSLIFGVAGRQVAAKGIDILLRVVPRVTALAPRARFLIAGDGPKLEEYRKLANDLNVTDKVIFLGRCESMPEFYASLDCFLLPSLAEGLPIALLEAMASARIVIASDVGSVQAVVRHQETGLLVPPGSLEALTSAILFVCSNYERLSRLGSAARGQILVHHSSSRMVKRYAEIYRSLERV